VTLDGKKCKLEDLNANQKVRVTNKNGDDSFIVIEFANCQCTRGKSKEVIMKLNLLTICKTFPFDLLQNRNEEMRALTIRSYR
jgi:hypothetical protein